MNLFRPKANNRVYSTLLLLTAYLLLTLILTWPTVTQLNTHLPGDGGDDPAIAWNLWWIKYALLNEPQNPFQTDFMFYPLGINLAFYTLTLLNGLTALPLTLAGGVVLASNLHLFFTFMVGGYGVFLLTRYLMALNLPPKSGANLWWSAAIAGGMYTFASNKLFYVALGQFNIASTHWVPFTLLYLLRLHHTPARLKNGVMAALFFTMQAWTEMTYASFILIFLGIYWLFMGLRLAFERWAGRTGPDRASIFAWLRVVGVMGFLFLIGLSPILAQMLPDMRAEGDFLVEGSGFAESFSADLAGFVLPTMHHSWFGQLVTQSGIMGFNLGQHIYVGFVLLGLTAIAVAGYRRFFQVWFWLGAAFFFALLCLGPRIIIAGQVTPLAGPFSLLQLLPFFNGNRYPSRFSVMLMLSMAVLAAFGLARLGAWLKDRGDPALARPGLLGLIALLFLLEHLSLPLPQSNMQLPPAYRLIAADPAEVTVLDIPFAWRNGFRVTGALTNQFMFGQFYQSAHQKRLLQGNTSRNPEFKFRYFTEAPIINSLLALETGKTLPPEQWQRDRAIAAQVLDFFGIKYIVVRPGPGDNPVVTPQATTPYIEQVLPAEKIYEDALSTVYRVRELPEMKLSEPLLIRSDTPLTPLYLGEGWGLTIAGHPLTAQRSTARLMLPLERQAYRLTLRLRLPPGLAEQRLTLTLNGWESSAQTVKPEGAELVFELPATAIQPGLNQLYLHFAEVKALPPPATGTPIFDVTVLSAGEEVGGFGHIFVNGYDISPNTRGYNLAVIQPGTSPMVMSFDTHGDANASQRLSQYPPLLNPTNQAPGTIIAVAAADEASHQLRAEAVQVLQKLGASGDLRGCFRCSHAFLSMVKPLNDSPLWEAGGESQTLEALAPLRPAAVTSSWGLTEPQVAALIDWIRLETTTP